MIWVQGSEEGYLRKTALKSVVIDVSSVWDQEGSSPEGEPGTSCNSLPGQQGQEQVKCYKYSLTLLYVPCFPSVPIRSNIDIQRDRESAKSDLQVQIKRSKTLKHM